MTAQRQTEHNSRSNLNSALIERETEEKRRSARSQRPLFSDVRSPVSHGFHVPSRLQFAFSAFPTFFFFAIHFLSPKLCQLISKSPRTNSARAASSANAEGKARKANESKEGDGRSGYVAEIGHWDGEARLFAMQTHLIIGSDASELVNE